MNQATRNSILAAAIALACWYAWPSHTGKDAHGSLEMPQLSDVAQQPVEPQSVNQTSRIQTSPFGKGAPPAAPDKEKTIAILRKTLKEFRLHTPERYYHLGFKDLRQLAEKRDIYAILQLGMQYTFTQTALEYDKDYDFSVSAKQEAFKLFNTAAAMGNTTAMVMLSTKLADASPVEAYAWKILSDQITSESHVDQYKANAYNFQLGGDDIKKAQIMSEEFKRQILSRPPTPPPSE